MGCPCKIPVTLYPETAEWGPIFWAILHGLAEQCGRHSSDLLQTDEQRGWINLLITVQMTIPCEICRGHYGEYLKKSPVEAIKEIAYKDLKVWVKTWLWTLHNEINEGNERALVSFDALVLLYSKTDIRERLKALEAPIRRAMTLNGVRLLHWKAFEGAVKRQLAFL